MGYHLYFSLSHLIISCGLQSIITVSRMGHLEIEFGKVEWTKRVSFATQSTPALSILNQNLQITIKRT